MQEITKITSRDNARLVRARKVRDGRADELIFIEGKRLVSEALKSDLVLLECFVADTFDQAELREAIERSGAAVAELPERLMGTISDTANPQGIALLAERPVTKSAPFTDRNQGALPIYIYLKEVNNPSNLGAIVRTAEAAGAQGILLSPRSADPYSAKALRASMGSAFRLPIWENIGFGDAVTAAKQHSFQVAATGISAADEYLEADLARPTLLVMGSEAHGLSEEDLSMADLRIRIDLAREVESLNLAVAAGVVIFEMKRQLRERLKAD
jgi:TrmH family RNA methyltransferase